MAESPALVDDGTFRKVQVRLGTTPENRTDLTDDQGDPTEDQSGPPEPRRTRHPYQLRGRMFCGLCNRRMQGSWNNSKPHYRCVFPEQYALANRVHHPRSVYVREELVGGLGRPPRSVFTGGIPAQAEVVRADSVKLGG